jgi:hypothetical protein
MVWHLAKHQDKCTSMLFAGPKNPLWHNPQKETAVRPWFKPFLCFYWSLLCCASHLGTSKSTVSTWNVNAGRGYCIHARKHGKRFANGRVSFLFGVDLKTPRNKHEFGVIWCSSSYERTQPSGNRFEKWSGCNRCAFCMFEYFYKRATDALRFTGLVTAVDSLYPTDLILNV